MACRVAIVDDAEDIRLLLRLNLEEDDRFEVVGEAGDGEEGVELAAAEQPDVILLDIAMPKLDGLQAIPMIRERAPQSKILVLSGLEADQVSHTALSLGAHGYLEKGAPVAEVGESILELCAA